MPVSLNQESLQFGRVILWEVTEDEQFFRDELALAGHETALVESMHPKRRKEWLCGRYLIRQFLDIQPKDVVIDQFGKPQLPSNDTHISISHSGGKVALAYANHLIGLDIQQTRPGISKLAHKFCTDNDYSWLSEHLDEVDIQHLVWVSKEAVYKAFGRRMIDFRKDIIIRSCQKTDGRLVLGTDIKNDDLSMSFDVFTRVWPDMYSAVAVIK